MGSRAEIAVEAVAVCRIVPAAEAENGAFPCLGEVALNCQK
jgi:hypothetical protein